MTATPQDDSSAAGPERAVPRPRIPGPTATPAIADDGQCRRILVVDDAATVRLYHGEILRRSGFVVDEAGNGLEAIELVLRIRYDLALVDVNMPQLDGYGLVRRLRTPPFEVSHPIVMASTENTRSAVAASYRVGANSYLVKPVAPARLVSLARLLTSSAALGRPA